MDEVVYLLTFWLGRCPALARVASDGRVIYADTYRELSQLLLQQLITETALDTLPATSKYKLHPRRLQEWLGRHGMAIGLLGDSAPPKPLDAQRMASLRWVFPELTGDPFWRIFQSVMLTSPEAVTAKAHLPLIAAQLQAVEIFDAQHPRTARDLLEARVLQEVFYLRDRAIKVALERSEAAYRQLHLDHGFVSDAKARRAMLCAVVTASEIRTFWRERTIAAEDVRALLPALSEGAGSPHTGGRAAEMLKRSMLRVIERQVALRYTGETWDEVISEEPVLAALNARRSVGRDERRNQGVRRLSVRCARRAASGCVGVADFELCPTRFLCFPTAAGIARADRLRAG